MMVIETTYQFGLCLNDCFGEIDVLRKKIVCSNCDFSNGVVVMRSKIWGLK